MAVFWQIMLSLWAITTLIAIVGYSQALSYPDATGLVHCINDSDNLNTFGKIFLQILYVVLCPLFAVVEWLIIAMTYHKK